MSWDSGLNSTNWILKEVIFQLTERVVDKLRQKVAVILWIYRFRIYFGTNSSQVRLKRFILILFLVFKLKVT